MGYKTVKEIVLENGEQIKVGMDVPLSTLCDQIETLLGHIWTKTTIYDIQVKDENLTDCLVDIRIESYEIIINGNDAKFKAKNITLDDIVRIQNIKVEV